MTVTKQNEFVWGYVDRKTVAYLEKSNKPISAYGPEDTPNAVMYALGQESVLNQLRSILRVQECKSGTIQS